MMIDLDKDSLHHAYVIQGEERVVLPELLKLFPNEKDLHINSYETFYIEDGQIIRNLASLSSDRQLFILSFRFITKEAQNSLLKLLEEPNKNTTFFLIVPNTSILLSTVISRLYPLKVTSLYDLTDAKEFLTMTMKERLFFFNGIIKEKDKSAAILFLGNLERELYAREETSVLPDVLLAENYMYDRGASIKMLLEYIAVVVPKY